MKRFAWSQTVEQNLFISHHLEKILILKCGSFHWKLYLQKHHFCYHSFFRTLDHICLCDHYLLTRTKETFTLSNGKMSSLLYWGSKRFTFKKSFGIKTYFLFCLCIWEVFKNVFWDKRAFVYLSDLFTLVLAHFSNSTASFPVLPFIEKLQFLVFV